MISLGPAAGNLVTKASQYLGTQSECQAKITALGLTPLPDPALVAARQAKTSALTSALRTALLAQFAGIAPQWQYALNGARLALNADLLIGNFSAAISAVTAFPLPDPSLASFQTAVLATLNQYAPLFAAAQSATTIDAVNAVALPA